MDKCFNHMDNPAISIIDYEIVMGYTNFVDVSLQEI